MSLLSRYRRGDDEIRGIALRTVIWDADVPTDAIEIRVEQGWVTLKGEVGHQFQSGAAFDDVAGLYGVRGVSNHIKVRTP